MALKIGIILIILLIGVRPFWMYVRQSRQQAEIAKAALLHHICRYQDSTVEREMNSIEAICTQFNWDNIRFEKTKYQLLREGKIYVVNEVLFATASGFAADLKQDNLKQEK